jgi:hypothetical protein
MARRPNAENIYGAAGAFRERCLSGKASLLWPHARAWTVENLQSLWSSLMEHPDVSERTFFAKLKDQIAPANDDVCRVAADILAFYYLFPARISAATKLRNVREVVGWKGLENGLDLNLVEAAFNEGGIGHPGVYYNTGLPNLFGFLVGFGLEALRQGKDVEDAETIELLAEAAAARVPQSTQTMRNVLLHLLKPDAYERIASDKQKQRILETYASLDPGAGTIDFRLAQVRKGLAGQLDRPDLDFYDPDLFERWKPSEQTSEVEEKEAASTSAQVWIEKTHVEGNPSRASGEHALGRALWSPQRSQNRADIYRFMRDVRPDDIVLHLTDNEGFTGVSRVAGAADDTFVGLPDTDWAGMPGYRIQLKDFRPLKPPLNRDVFFSPPFSQRLVKLVQDGTRNLFYNGEPNLNQGAYLTPAPPALVSILNDAYRSIAHRDLVENASAGSAATAAAPVPVAPTELAAVCDAFSNALQACGVSFGTRHHDVSRSFVVSLATKRFVILTGLSGSGKTQLGLRFGEWLGPSRYLVVPVRPDWTGAEALFGFEDALQPQLEGRKAWQVPEALQFMLRAADDPANPYLLLLDEMNLAHVERYFADVLSGMESGQPCLPNLAGDPDGTWRLKRSAPGKLPVPANLFVVGTVNVDETTYMFSPKVLDRANTFEFRVRTEDLVASARRPTPCVSGDPTHVAAFAGIAADANWHIVNPAPGVENFKRLFELIHELLVPLGFEYGHRTYVEALRFAALLAASGEADPLRALDLQIMQKILPRVHGSRRRLEPVLSRIGAFCLDPNSPRSVEATNLSDTFDPVTSPPQAPLLPISFDKVRRMTVLLRANQFVSFTE